jgi:hypothetical protein
MPIRPDNVDDEMMMVASRRILLDGLTALHSQLEAVTVVGAQAVYLRTADAPIRVAAFTSDGDLSLDPQLIANEPLLEDALRAAGFELIDSRQPGLWARNEALPGVDEPVQIELDLLIGQTLVPKAGTRSVRIPPHDKNTAKKVPGLEPTVVDRSLLTITALDPTDDRSITVHVAGPTALLIAKAHKLHDRFAAADRRPDRLGNKDASDVYRLMTTARPAEVASTLTSLMANERVGTVAATGLGYLREQFGGADTPGVRLAIQALEGDVPAERIRALAPAFISALQAVSWS